MAMLDDDLGQLYAQALLTVARVDGEIGPEEGARLRDLVATRTDVPIDYEASFFHKVTSDELAAAVEKASQGAYRTPATAITGREIGRAFVHDAISLATADGELNGPEAQTILRYARALGCSATDIRAETNELDEFLS
jgi:tellurite resistance protein